MTFTCIVLPRQHRLEVYQALAISVSSNLKLVVKIPSMDGSDQIYTIRVVLELPRIIAFSPFINGSQEFTLVSIDPKFEPDSLSWLDQHPAILICPNRDGISDISLDVQIRLNTFILNFGV